VLLPLAHVPIAICRCRRRTRPEPECSGELALLRNGPFRPGRRILVAAPLLRELDERKNKIKINKRMETDISESSR
jgi:hypothetical protein